MKTRFSRGFAALILVALFALQSASAYAAPRGRDLPSPGEKIVRFLKGIRTIFVPAPFTDGINPPKP
jgi:hypothetical protein